MESQARANELERLAQEREAALAALTAQMNELLAQRRDGQPQTEPALASLYGVEGQTETAPAPDAPQNEWPAQPAEAERLAAEREAALAQLTDQLRQAQARLDLDRDREATLATLTTQANKLQAQLKSAHTALEEARGERASAERLAFERETALSQLTQQLSDLQARADEARAPAHQRAADHIPARKRKAHVRTSSARRNHEAPKPRKTRSPKRR